MMDQAPTQDPRYPRPVGPQRAEPQEYKGPTPTEQDTIRAELAELRQAVKQTLGPQPGYLGEVAGAIRAVNAAHYVSEAPKPNDNLNLFGAISVTVTDARQLLEELQELRARLAPILVEREVKHNGRPMLAVGSKAGETLSEAHCLIANCRELVYFTLAQLDI